MKGREEDKRRKKKGGTGLSNHYFDHMARTTKTNLISARGNTGHNFEVCKLGLWQLCLPSVNSPIPGRLPERELPLWSFLSLLWSSYSSVFNYQRKLPTSFGIHIKLNSH